jgi:hypothetical protein
VRLPKKVSSVNPFMTSLRVATLAPVSAVAGLMTLALDDFTEGGATEGRVSATASSSVFAMMFCSACCAVALGTASGALFFVIFSFF